MACDTREKETMTETVKKNDTLKPVVDPAEDETPYIVYREPYVENGVQMNKEHRVPLAEWPAYEKAHGL
jgi:hypothetical protein